MKKIIGFAVIVLLMSFSINAQQKQERSRKGSDFTAEQKATLMTKQMVLKLDLTDSQEKKVYAFVKGNAENRETTIAEFKKQKEDGVKITSDQRYEMQLNRIETQIEHKAVMKTILSKEQFEKWELMKKSNMRKGKKKMGYKGKSGERQQGSRNKNKS